MQSVRLTYTPLEQLNIRFKNILKMLKRRGVVDDDEKIFEKNKPESVVNNIFKFNSDKDKNQLITINISSITVNSISKNSSLDDFLSQDINMIKILVLPHIPNKIINQIKSYKNSEVFELLDFDEDIISKDFVMEHRILTDEEKEIIKNKYRLSNLPKIQEYDKMVRYYNAKVGDVMEVKRTNINSIKSNAYRLVVLGNQEMFF